MQVVLCDTSPIRYLVQIDVADLLGKLYGRVLIPESVAAELNQPRTPDNVKRWIANPPGWLEVVPLPKQHDRRILPNLDLGERDAILLALERKADLLIMDERDGVREATRLGLTVTGTLGLLDRAAERQLVDLRAALTRLRATNFRVSPALLDRLIADDARRKME